MFKKILGSVALSALAAATFATPALAAGGQGGAATVVLNPGGAREADGSDGIVIIINGLSEGAGISLDDGNDDTSGMYVSANGSDQVYFAQVPQWCCSGVGPVLNVGGTAIGEAQAAGDTGTGESWDSITVVASSGAKELIANGSTAEISSSATGNASATIRYSETIGGLTYTIDREISYTFPNTYYDETWTVTIPGGNNAEVDFYLGGDAAPGGTDSGTSESVTIGGKLNLREKNLESGQYISYMETSASSPFGRYFVGNYDDPYPIVMEGGDLPNTVADDESHDAGIMIQWSFGTTPGSYEKVMRTKIGFNNEFELAETGVDASALALAGFALASLGLAVVAVRRRARA